MTNVEHLQHRIDQLEADQQQLQAEKLRAEAEKQQAEAEREQLAAENAELREKLEQQELEYKLLIERVFGPKSERYIDDPDQLKLDFGDGDQIDDAVEGLKQAKEELEIEVEGYTRRRKKRCEKLPEHLPRKIVTIDLPEDEKDGLTCIGYDSTETLIFVPPKLSVRETRYPKYVDPANSKAGVKQREREPGLVEGNRYGMGVAAQIVTAKYGYHLPVYRQQDIFAGSGWSPSRSTLLNILTSVALLIQPLIEYFCTKVRSDSVIGSDDTGVKLLLPKEVPNVDPLDPKSARAQEVIQEAIEEGKPHVSAKMWAYRGVSVPLNVFDFTVSRHRDGPDLFLVETAYKGTLLGDCYGANVGITMRSSGLILHAACASHARRKVREAKHNHKVHADQLLSMFRELYDIEDRGRTMTAAERLALRQTEARAVWNRMRSYLDNEMTNVLPKEKMAEAVGYLNNQWDALTLYLSDASIPIDNNETEQLMKQVAIGRKNWLFIGSLAAGYRAADLMTLVSSAIRNDLDVWVYVKGVLDALLSGSTDYESLRPDVWAANHPDQIRTYRVEERQRRSARQEHQRKRRRLARQAGL